MVDYITKLKNGTKVLLLAPFRRHAKREVKEELNILVQKGFSRLYTPGSEGTGLVRIEELLEQKKISVPDNASGTHRPAGSKGF